MYRHRKQLPPPSKRRGVILLVVITLLTLFAVIGLSFALYAESSATAARIYREAQRDPDELENYLRAYRTAATNAALGQLLYDVPDDATGVYSAGRGHSFGRTMFGANSGTGIVNTTPFNGTGRLHTAPPPPAPTPSACMNPYGLDDYYLVNYTFFRSAPVGGQVYLRDPERLNTNPTLANTWRTSDVQAPGPYTGGANAPYTYPDLNNMFLAAVRADGLVMMPSFHRPWLFDTNVATLGTASPGPLPPPLAVAFDNPAHPNWTNTEGRMLLLRPRPIDNLTQSQVTSAGLPWPLPTYSALPPPQQATLMMLIDREIKNNRLFPYPEDAGGDVKNLLGAPARSVPDGPGSKLADNDSVWVDFGAQVQALPDGRKFKPLFAFLIRDLDNLVNVNVHGNLAKLDLTAPGTPRSHGSHEGWGKWEVNLGQILNAAPVPAGAAPEWQQLLLNGYYGRYNYDNQPGVAPPPMTTPTTPPYAPPYPLPSAPFYSRYDFDARRDNTAGSWLTTPPLSTLLPNPGAGTFSTFPAFTQPNNGYDGGNQVATEYYREWTNHPGNSNVNFPGFYTPADRHYDIVNVRQLMSAYSSASNYEYSRSQLGRILPLNLADPANLAACARRRNLITTISADVDQVGVAPWVWDPADAPMAPAVPTRYQYDPALGYPHGLAIGFPQLSTRTTTPPPNGSEYNTAEWRALPTRLGRLNLDRPLRPYPAPDAGGFIDVGPAPPAMGTPAQAATRQQMTNAVADRTKLARDILNRLCAVTGAVNPVLPPDYTAPNPATPAFGSVEYDALRWLAQLAVNIVDYIDRDGYSTAFQWNRAPAMMPIMTTAEIDAEERAKWVYGTELPRLVLNEAYVQVNNLAGETMTATGYEYNVWAELHNPLTPPTDGTLSDGGVARLKVTPPAATGVMPYAPYNIVITNPPAMRTIRNADNVRGEPDGTVLNTPAGITDFSPGNTPVQMSVAPAGGAYADPGLSAMPPTPGNAGFYVIGPTGFNPAVDPGVTTTTTHANMRWTTTPDIAAMTSLYNPSIVLRKLACEHLPAQTNPTQADYNPWLTVDYVDDVPRQDGRVYDGAGMVVIPPPAQFPTRESYGKKQPYAGRRLPAPENQWLPQNPIIVPPPPMMTPPALRHTFYRHNGREAAPPVAPVPADMMPQTLSVDSTTVPATPQLVFDWLVHLDRSPTSPVDLLHVSAYKPHELTQQFFVPRVAAAPGQMPQHLAPWGNEQARIYRLFEFLLTTDRSAGAHVGGRTQGKININTIWDMETFLALCDGRPAGTGSNFFTDATVNAAWTNLVAARTPSLLAAPPARQIQPNDRPFLPFSTGVTPPTDPQFPSRGRDQTLLRNITSTTTPILDVPGAPHYALRAELLSKIFGSVTVRSNVFAVWCTIGFFEVIDKTSLPVKLGAEIGAATGQNYRPKFFAIVDRTGMRVAPPPPPPPAPPPAVPTLLTAVPAPAAPATGQPGIYTLGVSSLNYPSILTVTPPSPAVTLAAGMQIVVADNATGANEEIVTILDVNVATDESGLPIASPNIRAQFMRPHPAGARINNVLGSPGPQPNFDYRQASPVILKYFAFLE